MDIAAQAEPVKIQRRKIPLKRKILYIAVCWAMLLMLVVGAEGTARLLAPQKDSLEFFIERSKQADFSAEQGTPIFTGDAMLTWRLKPNLHEVFWDYTLVSTNGQGLRQPGQVGTKPKGTRRVICFGDSVTFGYRIPVVFPNAPTVHNPEHLPYPVVLGQQLNQRFKTPVEVINMGVPGYTTHQGLARARRDLAKYDPDLVVICFGWNDTDMRPEPDRLSLSMSPTARIRRWLLEHSRLCQLMSPQPKAAEDAKAPAGPVELFPRVSRERYVENTLAIAEQVTRLGAVPLILGPVYRDATTNPDHAKRMNEWRAALRAAAEKQGVAYMEIPELMETAAPDNARLFGEVIHPNELGARLMAQRVAGKIEELGVIEK